MSDYFDITLNIFDESPQRVSVQRQLMADELVDEIIREFSDLDKESKSRYGLFIHGSLKPLQLDMTLRNLNIQSGDVLDFGWLPKESEPSDGRRPIHPAVEAILVEKGARRRFPIAWQPFVIGRVSRSSRAKQLVGVDLSGYPNDRRVSRRHAVIREAEGRFYIESMESRNPTFLNDKKLPFGAKKLLQSGDTIEIGTSKIVLEFFARRKKNDKTQ